MNVSVELLNPGSTFLLFQGYCAVGTIVITRPTPPLAPNIVNGREGDRNACDRAQPDVFIVRISV